MIGDEIYGLLSEMFPICRSITGEGNRQTLRIIQDHIPLEIYEIPTGQRVYDWDIPMEWNIRDAYIIDPNGEKILDFKNNNLHVINYSIPVNTILSREELEGYLYSIPDKPDAIPYITSYYKEKWGFCISQNQRKDLIEGDYRVFIDSEFTEGSLTYGELIIPGKLKEEVLVTTYICHPSMANNECSGPAVSTFLAKWLLKEQRNYTYRFVFAPETIGAIAYISKNYDALVSNTIAGFNLTCVGDNNTYSMMPSRQGITLTDKIARHVLENYTNSYKEYSFLFKGSDERQYCHPKVDLPLVSVMRSKYGTFPEYHTSLDNLNFVSPQGLQGGYEINRLCIEALEDNHIYECSITCEPKMIKRNLRPKNWHLRHSGGGEKMRKQVRDMMNVIFYCDGDHDLVDISNKVGISFQDCSKLLKKLEKNGIIHRR